ncbi:ELWxxDGT repeat protein [Luteolibacter soli]|uniref:ELWxxDGT repeat protein n=1 Tax=Luteolibacter soli TaxID=3135280 RepID=A0ABU9AVZ7_9BACT
MIPAPRSSRASSLLLTVLAAAFTFTGTPAPAQEQTAKLVKDLNRAPGDYSASIDWAVPLGNRALFVQSTFAYGSEPWISDGTPAGTHLLKDVVPGPGGSHPNQPLPFADGTKVAFHRDSWATGDKIWVTDGTEAGTVQAYVVPAPPMRAQLQLKAGTTTGVFFEQTEVDGNATRELLFTDGTAAGTWTLNPINGDGNDRFAQPTAYATTGPWCYFIASGNEVWRSDGTVAGTAKVLTITTGTPAHLALAGTHLFVDIAPASGTHELWSGPANGGDLTRIDSPQHPASDWLEHAIALGDELFFLRQNSSELWASDGTAAGTRQIALLDDHGTESVVGASFTLWKDALYFRSRTDQNINELWRTDGTAAGTTRLSSSAPSYYPSPYMWGTGDYLYFHEVDVHASYKSVLWRTQGDPASTRRVKGPAASGGYTLTGTDSGFFFTSGDNTPDETLFAITGKKPKPVPLTQPEKSTALGIEDHYEPDSYEMAGGNIVSFVWTGDRRELWSIAPDGSRTRAIWRPKRPEHPDWEAGFCGTTPHGALFIYESSQLWITDGTAKGTRLLADHSSHPGSNDGYVTDFVKLGDTWYYSAESSLWKTDGTKAGTSRVSYADPDGGTLVTFQGSLYFLSTDRAHTVLWRSDGTEEGTVWVEGSWNNPFWPTASHLSVAGGQLLLFARHGDDVQLWQSDGTTEGTIPVSPSAIFETNMVSKAFDLGDKALFRARQPDEPENIGVRWWCHDATGTRPVRDDMIGQTIGFSASSGAFPVGSQLFYCPEEDDGLPNFGNAELWVTNGTSAGTRKVKDIGPGILGSSPDNILVVGNQIYFTAYDLAHGNELWRSDGTEAGTVLVADIEPGEESSTPTALKVMDGKLYFTAHRNDVDWELFSIDLPQD